VCTYCNYLAPFSWPTSFCTSLLNTGDAHYAASPPWSQRDAGDNILSMLEEDEVALKRAELHVIEARGRVSDQSAKISRLKSRGESSLEAEQDLGLFEAYLLIVERHRDFLLRSRKQRPHKR
jgi:hypothetical protein